MTIEIPDLPFQVVNLIEDEQSCLSSEWMSLYGEELNEESPYLELCRAINDMYRRYSKAYYFGKELMDLHKDKISRLIRFFKIKEPDTIKDDISVYRIAYIAGWEVIVPAYFTYLEELMNMEEFFQEEQKIYDHKYPPQRPRDAVHPFGYSPVEQSDYPHVFGRPSPTSD